VIGRSPLNAAIPEIGSTSRVRHNGKRGLSSMGMMGDNPAMDLHQGGPVKDPLEAFGATIQYDRKAAEPWRLYPMGLRSGNKPSDHNISNMVPTIVVAQLAPQIPPPRRFRLLSYRVVLPTAGGV
jgi:hypothetical protein